MSAQVVAELVAGPEPPWLKLDPIPYWVTSAGVRAARSICIICPYFSLAVICPTSWVARSRQTCVGKGPLGTVDPPPAPPPDEMVAPAEPAALPARPAPAPSPTRSEE